MEIDCNRCVMQNSDHCGDCVVRVLLDFDPESGGVVIDADEERAIRVLADAGLIPTIRMKPRRRTA